jgi:CRP/FNR family transcriptional regulator, cyclic AMP receptor protein
MPISQEVLAARVGATRSRIKHFMNKFRTIGLIEYNADLKVHSSLLNVIVGSNSAGSPPCCASCRTGRR